MRERQKIVAAIHDLSGFGRCALSVILPTISAMGIQCVPVPTAVLSTHTGGFEGYILNDLTDHIPACLDHYRSLGIVFDAVYTGFLASEEQADGCLGFFRAFPSAMKVVDPVLGDHGAAYRTCTEGLIRRMIELARRADVITPNPTEAALLLGEEYREVYTEAALGETLRRLSELTPAVALTGVTLDEGSYLNAAIERGSGAIRLFRLKKLPVLYPGTGDLFASVLTGGLLRGEGLFSAADRASAFCSRAIAVTMGNGAPPRNGVEFERVLGFLAGGVSGEEKEGEDDQTCDL
ncbi:MAG: pyridoxamine kinase [Bacteroides sp.]|nr:pyridoxamine kinase [Eubacterium sp.]MCM1418713.1 pyridoxamine kinase [Roseburia sp.]MCM1462779.1 pyridoxamine kinase [Bacteroides sp.]